MGFGGRKLWLLHVVTFESKFWGSTTEIVLGFELFCFYFLLLLVSGNIFGTTRAKHLCWYLKVVRCASYIDTNTDHSTKEFMLAIKVRCKILSKPKVQTFLSLFKFLFNVIPTASFHRYCRRALTFITF